MSKSEPVPPPTMQIPALRNVRPSLAIAIILLASAAAFAFLFWLIYGRHSGAEESSIVGAMPAMNASLNGLSTVLLVSGFVQVRRRNYQQHMRLMIAALVSSTLFLVNYIVYHAIHRDTPFTGIGIIRPIYFFVLISHIVLSAIALPMILTSFYLALAGKFTTHKRLSRFTFALWLYVSVTGVLVFALLKCFNES